jgi:hypothetical protein
MRLTHSYGIVGQHTAEGHAHAAVCRGLDQIGALRWEKGSSICWAAADLKKMMSTAGQRWRTSNSIHLGD